MSTVLFSHSATIYSSENPSEHIKVLCIGVPAAQDYDRQNFSQVWGTCLSQCATSLPCRGMNVDHTYEGHIGSKNDLQKHVRPVESLCTSEVSRQPSNWSMQQPAIV